MIQIFMLNRGEDFARFKRGEAIVVGPGVIVQLESKLTKSARAEAHNGAASVTRNGTGTPRKTSKRRQYTAAYKKEIVAEALKKGWSSYESGKHHGISGSVILRWLRNAKKAKA